LFLFAVVSLIGRLLRIVGRILGLAFADAPI
jgi:hypothetical protein